MSHGCRKTNELTIIQVHEVMDLLFFWHSCVISGSDSQFSNDSKTTRMLHFSKVEFFPVGHHPIHAIGSNIKKKGGGSTNGIQTQPYTTFLPPLYFNVCGMSPKLQINYFVHKHMAESQMPFLHLKALKYSVITNSAAALVCEISGVLCSYTEILSPLPHEIISKFYCVILQG